MVNIRETRNKVCVFGNFEIEDVKNWKFLKMPKSCLQTKVNLVFKELKVVFCTIFSTNCKNKWH